MGWLAELFETNRIIVLLVSVSGQTGLARPLRVVPAVAVGLWALFTLAISRALEPGFQPDPGSWLPSAQIGPALNAVGAPLAVGDVVARALIAVPASLLVALGLR